MQHLLCRLSTIMDLNSHVFMKTDHKLILHDIPEDMIDAVNQIAFECKARPVLIARPVEYMIIHLYKYVKPNILEIYV